MWEAKLSHVPSISFLHLLPQKSKKSTDIWVNPNVRLSTTFLFPIQVSFSLWTFLSFSLSSPFSRLSSKMLPFTIHGQGFNFKTKSSFKFRHNLSTCFYLKSLFPHVCHRFAFRLRSCSFHFSCPCHPLNTQTIRSNETVFIKVFGELHGVSGRQAREKWHSFQLPWIHKSHYWAFVKESLI